MVKHNKIKNNRLFLKKFTKFFIGGFFIIILLTIIEIFPPAFNFSILLIIIITQTTLMMIVIFFVALWETKNASINNSRHTIRLNQYWPILISDIKKWEHKKKNGDKIVTTIGCDIKIQHYLMVTIICSFSGLLLLYLGLTLSDRKNYYIYFMIFILSAFLLFIYAIGYLRIAFNKYHLIITTNYIIWPLPSPGNPISKHHIKINNYDVASISIIKNITDNDWPMYIQRKNGKRLYASLSQNIHKDLIKEFEESKYNVCIEL